MRTTLNAAARVFRVSMILFLMLPSLLAATAQHAHGRGAMSAQDMQKMKAAALITPSVAVNPKSLTGTGQVSLSVNTTPAHPRMRAQGGGNWFLAGGGASLACLLLAAFPRPSWRGPSRRRQRSRGPLMFALALSALAFTILGCGGAASIEPGTAKGTYAVIVTATAANGASSDQASLSVPVTIQ